MAKRLNKNLVGGLTALAFVVIAAAGVFMVSSLGHVDPQHYVQKAEGFAADGDYDKAATCYWRAFRVSENPEYLVDVGNMTELSGDEIKAVEAWIQATNIDSELLEAHERILDVYMQGWPASRIKETAEVILRIEEKNPKGLHALGVALIQLAGQPGGDREKGFENLEAAREIAPEVYEYSRSLALYYWEDAITLVETKPEEARGQVGGQALSLVRDLVTKNVTPGEDAANARILYARLLSSPFPPQHEKVLLSMVNDHLGDRDRYSEAEALFQQAVEMAGDDAEVQSEAMTALARYWYGRSTRETDEARAKEHQEKAVGLSRQAIETWPTGFNSYRFLAQIFASGGEYEKAAQVCVERADLPIDRKGLKAAVQKRGRIQLLLFAAEQYIIAASLPELSRGSDEQLALAEKAEQLVVDAQAEVPDPDRHGQSLHVLGKIKYVQGRELEALAYFENADKADGTPTLAKANKRWLGILRFQQGQIGGAREALLEAIRNNRRADAQTWLTLAKVHLAYDEPENAILSADEALKRSPGMIEALQVQIAANRKLGRQDLVDKLMEKIGEGQPENSVFRARVLYQQGRHQKAFDMLSAVLDENPASEPALRWLDAVARRLEKENEALARAEKAVEADPDNLALRAIAYGLDRNLTEEQKKEKLLSLIRETPDEYVRAYRLGEFYHTYNQPREAMGQYGKAAQLIMTKATEAARRAGSKGLLVALEKQLLLAIDQEWWDEIDAIVQAAIEQNVDGAHGMTFKGRVSLVRGKYAAATEAFRLALAEQPSQSETWGWLGESHYLAGRKTEARAAFTRAAEMNRNNFMAQRRLAQLAEDAGDLNDFNARLDQCVRLNPQDSWVQQQELVRQENKNPQEGIKRRLVHFEQNPEDWRNLVQLANLYRLAGNVEKATEFFSTALQNPDAPPGAAWRAAQFHAEVGDRDRAFQVLSDAGERAEPKQDKALILLLTGVLYRQLNDLDNSEKLFRQAVDLDPGEVTFIAFGEHYLALGEYPEALEWLEKGIEAADQAGSARAPTTRRTRFDTLLEVGDHAAAATAVEEYRNLYPKDPVGYLLESELQVALGEVNRAVDRLTRFLQDRPGDPEALYRRARLYASRQRWQAAIKDLEDLRAIDRDALNFEPRILLSRAYDRTDRSDLALSELKSLYEEHPDNDAICSQYFGYFLQHGRFADAETFATALVNRAPDNPVWHGFLGRAAARLQDSVKALASYREAARKSEDDDWKHCATLLDAYRRFDNHDAGIRFYEETLTADQRRAPLTYRYANLLADMGRTDEAVTAYRQALVPTVAAQDETFVVQVAESAVQAFGAERAIELFRAEPADESLKRPNQHVLARLLANLDHRSEAIGVLDSLIRTSTGGAELASLYGRKGIIAEMDGDPQRARQCYEEAVKANPGNYVVLNNLAFLLADKLGNPREAVPYAEKAVQITKYQQPDVVDTLAWTLVELGEYGRAIGLLTGTLQRNLEFIAGLVHRAEAYRRSGRFDDAVSDFEEASKLIDDSENPDDQAYREQVETGLQKARDRNAEP